MKFIILPYIALGLVLSLAIGIEYDCKGPEMFPTYYGSPFVFMQTSLTSSMEYHYNISGLLLSVLSWSTVLFLIDRTLRRIKSIKWARIGYNVCIGLLIVFSTLHVAFVSMVIGRGFNEHSNYWYWNMDKEARDWGMSCEGELKLFIVKR